MEEERSPGGSRIERHERARPGQPVGPDNPVLDAVEGHVERHLGPIESVFHEIVSEDIHLDLLRVEPTEKRPFPAFVTCGMSAKPMTVPEGMEELRFAELEICLPPDWPLTEEDFRDERNYWPLRLLKDLARLPHTYDTWLGFGHTMPNDDPPQPYAPGTDLCCALIGPALWGGEDFQTLDRPEGPINFYGVFVIYADEMEFKLAKGADALGERFDRAGVSELLVPDRPSALRRRKRFGIF
jgi:Suppressor of fused protein (SUFU)